MFLPTTREEMREFGWEKLDVIIVTGDTYIDSPYIGAAVIGNCLFRAGYRVGIIAQPDVQGAQDIERLGEPQLFWGITAGSVDSMVANFTASKKRRWLDDFTPGGKNTKRPDRASIVYSNLIRRSFKSAKPLVLGGVEASMRRIAHYDYWDDRVRKSILFDAKADLLVYGMAEKTILELAGKIKNNEDVTKVRGICYISKMPVNGCINLPSYEEAANDKDKFIKVFKLFYDNNDPLTAKGLCQKHGDRYLIQNPPSYRPSQKEIDEIYNMDYTRGVHPYYKKMGPVKAQETIKFSITTHRGCYGECNFCSIALHQGGTVLSRSEESILKEAQAIVKLPDFKGYISDVGGGTANMFGIECAKKLKYGSCADKRCIFPAICSHMPLNHKRQIELLRRIRGLRGIKKVFVASGLRYDMILQDSKFGSAYLREIVKFHISGQLKVAPEHSEDNVLRHMGKPAAGCLKKFISLFEKFNKELGKKQFLTYYFIAAHPGCEMADMAKLKKFVRRELRISPEQVQIFTPLPSTYSALMYWTNLDPFTGERIFVEKDPGKRERQKTMLALSS